MDETTEAGSRGAWKEIWHELLDGFFPPRCLVCGQHAPRNGWSCRAHELRVEEREARCSRCARRLPHFAFDGDFCPDCSASPPPLDRLVVLSDYASGEPVRDWILALKHGGRRDLAGPLGRALGLRHPNPDRALDVYIPVPLHPLRLFERGFDQAHALAQGAREVTGVAVRRGLRRARYTPPQGGVGSPARIVNMSAAIAASRGGGLRGKRVWLVDDVVTSGATLAACARVARKQGAAEVSALALAAAQPYESDV